MEVKLDL